MNNENNTMKLWEIWIYCNKIIKGLFMPSLDSAPTPGRHTSMFGKLYYRQSITESKSTPGDYIDKSI